MNSAMTWTRRGAAPPAQRWRGPIILGAAGILWIGGSVVQDRVLALEAAEQAAQLEARRYTLEAERVRLESVWSEMTAPAPMAALAGARLGLRVPWPSSM
jgi:hypothetical protein